MYPFPLYLILSLIVLCHCEDVMYSHTNQENNLYFVFTTFRHGARKPLPGTDYFGNRNYSAGALTRYGAIQHLEIGRNYRKRYSNFVNVSFDKNELYIRSSDVGRTIISTEKELEGFFNKTIDRSNIFIARGGGYFMNLFHLDPNEQAEMNKYVGSCKKRNLGKNFGEIYHKEIFPNVKKCDQMENIGDAGIWMFCDTMISHYFEYSYGNETYNIINRCSKENIQMFYDFCVEYYDSFRGWNELGAYMFYMLFQHIFQYMDNYINGRSKIRMMMIGGHDVTVGPLMDFLSGLNIIPRTHYPHYACNVVMELRKYGQDFYLEFYYNDILKYNNTLEIFKSILDKSKYSNLYNYCGVPSYLNISLNNATNQTINNQTDQTVKNESKIENVKNETNNTINNQTDQTIKNESKIENVKNETNNTINNQTDQTIKNESKIENVKNETNNTINNQTDQTIKNESKIENVKNETNNTINNQADQTIKNESIIENVKNETNNTINNQTGQTVNNESKNEIVINETNNILNSQNEKNDNATQKENQLIQNSTKEKETEKVEIIENNPNKNLLNNNDTLFNQNETNRKNQGKNFVQKSFNYLAQQDKNFYIMVICAIVVIVTLISFAIFVIIWRKKRRKSYIKFKEDVAKNVNPNNLSIMSTNPPEVKSEPQSSV